MNSSTSTGPDRRHRGRTASPAVTRLHLLFGLHMWVWRHSPDGVFSFWNTNVSCERAE